MPSIAGAPSPPHVCVAARRLRRLRELAAPAAPGLSLRILALFPARGWSRRVGGRHAL